MGKINDYLGMVLEFNTEGKAQVTMPKHTQRIMYTPPTDMDGLTDNPASNYLFQV